VGPLPEAAPFRTHTAAENGTGNPNLLDGYTARTGQNADYGSESNSEYHMDSELISQLASAGFVFAPTAMGMTRSNREGWPELATSDQKALQQWINEGSNLVTVAKHGHGFAIDGDDPAALAAKGFKMEWLDGYFVVDTPSGGFHAHGLHTPETEALGNLVVVHAVKGDTTSKKVFELKLHNQSVAAPTAIRLKQYKKKDGEYVPRAPFTSAMRGLPASMLGWLKEHAETPKPQTKSGTYAIEFHPLFEMESFLAFHECTEHDSAIVDGALHVVVDTCPLCGKDDRGSTLRAGVTKFIFGGNGVGFVCHACGVSDWATFNGKMDETYEDWESWSDLIYRHDDNALFTQDMLEDDKLVVEFVGAEPDEQDTADGCEASVETAEDSAGPDTKKYTYEPTDMGNGERLVRKFGKFIRYIAEIGQWMVWSRSGWRQDTNGLLMRMTKRIIAEITNEANEKFNAAFKDGSIDEDILEEARAIAKHAKNSARIDRRKAMIASAACESGVITNFNDWDADGWLLNVANGVIDLRTQTFRERAQTDLCIRQSPVVFDPNATCPVWESTMSKWMCGDMELVGYDQVAWGVSLTSDTSLQALFFCQGGGMNGKDTAFNVMGHVFGTYAQSAAFTTFTDTQNHSEHRNDIAVLAGAARMVTTCESSDGHALDEGVIKQVTGYSKVVCRHIHGKPFEYTPQYKLWMMSNYEPVIKGNDWGIWRRVKKIPWNYTVTEAEKDPNLTEKLKAEASGILNWLLDGVRQYVVLGQKLPPCKAVDDATAKYRKDMDIIGRFADQCLTFAAMATALGPDIYRRYKSWCVENGFPPLSSRRFFTEFRKRYSLQEGDANRGTRFGGVGILIDGSYPTPDWAD
jgi:putative DNA primase/helicase